MDTQENESPKKIPHKSRLRRVLRIFGCVLLGIVLLLIVLIAGLSVWLGTDSAHALLMEKGNAALVEPLKAQGLEASITRIEGNLPLHMRLGVKVKDEKGLFFETDDIRFDLDIAPFSRKISLKNCVINGAHLERVPILPKTPEEPKEETEPMTPSKLKALLEDISKQIQNLPGALPHVELNEIGLRDFSLGKDVIGFPAKATLLLKAQFSPKDEALATLGFGIETLSFSSKDLNVQGNLAYTSGKKEENFLAGDLLMKMHVQSDPFSLMQSLSPEKKALGKGEPLLFDLSMEGPLFTPNFSALLNAKSMTVEEQRIEKTTLSLAAAPLNLANILFSPKNDPLSLLLELKGSVNQENIALNLPLSAWRLGDNFADFGTNIHGMTLSAFGLKAQATLDAILANAKPKVQGTLNAHIEQWKAIEAFLPDMAFAGKIDANLGLTYKDEMQNAEVKVESPLFAVSQKNEKLLDLKGLSVHAHLKDLFQKLHFDTHVFAENINAKPLNISADAKVNGALDGKMHAQVMTRGNLETDILCGYEPGKVSLEKLRVMAAASLLNLGAPKNTRNAKGKKEAPVSNVGLVLQKAASIRFGDNGLDVDRIDVTLHPSGHLKLDGKLHTDSLRLSCALQKFDFQSLNSLVSGLPKGVLDFAASLEGSPKSPTGSLKVNVAKLSLDGLPLDPLDLALLGSLGHDKNLAVHLDLPKKTLTALGLDVLDVKARVPLSFAENGIPSLNEKAALDVTLDVRGKLASLWKFSPLSDSRLTGNLVTNAHVHGPLQNMKIQGNVNVEKGRFEDPINGILLRDLGARIVADGTVSEKGLGGGATIQAGFGDGMGGTFSLNGKTPLDASNLDITAKLDHLKPLRRQDMRISLSGEARVTGSATDPHVKGKIVVDNGAVQLENIETGAASITTLPISKGKKTVADSKKSEEKKNGKKAKKGAEKKEKKETGQASGGGNIDLSIQCPGKFLVDGYGLTSAWQTDLHITGALTNPVIAGEVSCAKGNLDFLNKNFTMEKGIVTLAGGNVANPILDMLLTNTTSDFTSHIRLTGTVKKLKLSLTSEPPMPQDDVLAHILFGRSANELGRYEALQLAVAVAKMGSGLGSGLNSPRKALGVDVMRLKSSENNSSQNNDSAVGGMALETGKYLTDSLYVGVEQGAKEGSSAGTIQYELTPRLRLELRSQQNNTSGSLNWKYKY